jgi:hypothetical protein
MQRKMICFGHLVDFCIHQVKNLWPQMLVKCEGNFYERKHVKMYIKTYVFIFCNSSFLPKYLCIITYACEKSSPPCKLS